jgi:hypothetical protein
MSDDLVEFVRACLDEDERAAQAAYDEASDYRVLGSRLAEEHFVLWKPDRVLAEVATKRAILELHTENTEWNGTSGPAICSTCVTFDTDDYYEAHREINFPCPTVHLLAEPFAGRPGWREEWAS